jgi:hypothetical protein
VGRQEEIEEILAELEPYLGYRRTARLNELRQHRAAVINERRRERTCAHCGYAFCPTNERWSRIRIYCSAQCRNAGNNRKQTIRKRALRAQAG